MIVGVGNVDLDLHGASRGIERIGEAGDLTGEVFACRLHMNVGGIANLHFRRNRFRHRNAQPQNIDLGDRHHRQAASVRGSGLHQSAGIGEAPGHDAVIRSGDPGVVAQSGIVLLVGARDFQLLLCGPQRRLGRLDLRLRSPILRGGIVELLLGDQSRAALCRY